jgi:hypothetical protein
MGAQPAPTIDVRAPRFAAPVAAERSAASSLWGSFWRSRALIWLAACLGIAVLGIPGVDWSVDTAGTSTALGGLGKLLTAPAVRWDAIWYLQIAHHGYQTSQATAFFPLYPLLVRIASVFTRSLPFAGILISMAALLTGLVFVRRLTELELGPNAARAAVDLVAFTPMAVFFSAVYTESLFLALSAGTFYAARRGRWPLAGALGALTAGTRLTGVVLLLPVLLLFFYGPREDRAPTYSGSRWRPRYRVSLPVLWIGLIPLGTVAFGTYLALRGYGPLSPLRAEQHFWGRATVEPLVGLIRGMTAVWGQLHFLAAGATAPKYESQGLVQIAVLGVAACALVATFRRLPLAYGAYAAVALLIPISSTTLGTGLVSFDRYASVVFPLYMAAGAWAAERGLTRKLVLLSSLGLVFFAVQFATWRFVA